jgi:NADH dehydrogenase
VRTALIGGTGFVGSYVVDELVANGHEPVLLVRPGSERWVRHRERCRVVSGTFDDDEALRETLAGCDAAIYLVGILREDPARGITFDALQRRGAERTIDLALAAGVTRFGLMSANGASPDGTPYQVSKWRAEQALRECGMTAVVTRPSVVFGDPRGRMEFCTQLRDQMILPPLPAPLFFDGLDVARAGRFELAPVHVTDVARVLVGALAEEPGRSQTHVLCGPESLQWREIIARIARALGRSKVAVPTPAAPIRAASMLLESQSWYPLTRDQLKMLLAGNTGDSSDTFERFGIEPIRFDDAALAYLR